MSHSIYVFGGHWLWKQEIEFGLSKFYRYIIPVQKLVRRGIIYIRPLYFHMYIFMFIYVMGITNVLEWNEVNFRRRKQQLLLCMQLAKTLEILTYYCEYYMLLNWVAMKILIIYEQVDLYEAESSSVYVLTQFLLMFSICERKLCEKLDLKFYWQIELENWVRKIKINYVTVHRMSLNHKDDAVNTKILSIHCQKRIEYCSFKKRVS